MFKFYWYWNLILQVGPAWITDLEPACLGGSWRLSLLILIQATLAQLGNLHCVLLSQKLIARKKCFGNYFQLVISSGIPTKFIFQASTSWDFLLTGNWGGGWPLWQWDQVHNHHYSNTSQWCCGATPGTCWVDGAAKVQASHYERKLALLNSVVRPPTQPCVW